MNNIQQINISTVMKIKYLDYAISVIAGRALPDVRDGLKWVHRRILYSMYELGITPDKGYRKSARIVGDVLGKYHPHGDSSVYDAMVRLAQNFAIGKILIDGQGNWGSIDGDSAAAMRYTEAKMSKIAMEMLKDINKNTVDFIPNFDGEEQEPSIMPSRFPNFLVNGSEGIAVGVATAIPPHNLNEVIDGIICQIDNPNCTIQELVKFIKAPDFPTCGEIINPQDMLDIYTNGYGKIIMRAKYHIETEDKQNRIIVTEIPYQVNKSKLLESIFNLTIETTKKVNNKDVIIKPKVPEIINVVDESDKEGMRISIVLKKNIDPNNILPLLFKYTDLQCNYNANFTAIYGTNQLLEHIPLKNIITYYINHQKEVISRRTQFDLDKANKRLHILNGLIKGVENIDRTIELIKTSQNVKEAKERLCNFLLIDENQAQAILDLRLQRLTGLEIETLKQEQIELLKTIECLEFILNNESKLLDVLKSELLEIKTKYGNERRTQLIYENKIKAMSVIDMVDQYNTKVILTEDNYIKKIPLTSLRGKGIDEQKLKDGDRVIQELDSSNKATLYMFTNKYNRYKINAYELEDKKPALIGEYIPNLIDLEKDEKIIKIISIDDESKAKGFITSVYENGKVAKVDIKSFISANKKLKNCYSNKSKLIDLEYVQEDVDIFMISSEGKGVIINTTNLGDVKESSNAQGNQSMKLGELEGNKVIACMIKPNQSLHFTLTTKKGKSKEYYLDDIAETSQTEKTWYKHLYSGSTNIMGNFIFNTRPTNDRVKEIVFH